MTPDPTAEARAAAEQIAGMIYEAAMVTDSCAIPCPGIDQMAPLIAAALDAFRKEGVERAEKWNGHTAREWSLALQSLTAQGSEFASDPKACVEYVRRDRADSWERINKTHSRIASLEAEIARVREERKLDGPIIEAQAATILLFRARLSPERLEKVAQAIEQKLYGVGDPDDVASILAVLQRELSK